MIVRACSYEATIKTPKVPSTYSKILVSFMQNGTLLINKDESSLTIDDDEMSVTVQLTQNETKLFDPSTFAMMQIRCYASAYDAPGSCLFGIKVCPALNDEVLS